MKFKTILYVVLFGTTLFGITPLTWAQTSNTRAAINEDRMKTKWPDAPGYKKVLGLFISHPISEPPANDLFKESTTDKMVRGKLIYVPLLYGQPASKWYFILRGIGHERLIGEKSTTIASYLSTVEDHVFNPQFSADGESLLFQMGDPEWRFGNHVVCLWDFKTKEIRGLTGSILNRTIYWSPDNKYLAYFEGGDAYGKWDDHITPPALVIHNLTTRTDYHVEPNPGAVRLAWTHQNTLLYTTQPKEIIQQPLPVEPPKFDSLDRPIVKSVTRPVTLPNIHEMSADKGTPKIVLAGGQDPVPSPDGRWVAFSGGCYALL